MRKLLLLMLLIQACDSNHEPAPPKPKKSNYIFSPVIEMPSLPVGSQGRSGTCWSFSTTSFLESEIIRIKGEKIDLSEMYFVRCAWLLKAENYILRQGTARFTEGGLNHDPIISMAAFGLMPQAAYSGLLNGQKEHNHFKMFETLERTVKPYADPANKLGTAWRNDVPAKLDSFMGKVSHEFQYGGKMYTPSAFLAYTKLNADDYVTITSFSHAAFYKPFVLSIPANWANGAMYNLPLDEWMANIDHAVAAGFTLALDLDATEATFSPQQGIAVWPENQEDGERILTDILPEKNVTQEMRQAAFENFSTTDDHLMHITGIMKDQQGHIFYKTKNSWGPASGRDGYIYVSIPYMRMKGISVLLHKDGLADTTRNKLFFKETAPQ